MIVTAIETGGAGSAQGQYLKVLAITGAAADQSAAETLTAAALSAAITPDATGSWIVGSLLAVGGSLTAEPSTTIIDTGHESGTDDGLAHAPLRTTSTTTGGTPVTVGASAGGTGIGLALVEILASGTLAIDGSSPAAAFSTDADFAVATASFDPPAGCLLVAIVSTNGAGGHVNTAVIADTSGFGLNWEEKAVQHASGAGYAGVWIARYEQAASPSPAGQLAADWTLAFADEFTASHNGKPDPGVWEDHYNNGDHQRTNNPTELQWAPHGSYGNSIAGSVMTQTGRFEDPSAIDPNCPVPLDNGGDNNGLFTAGILSSQPSFSATYGYWESRIRVPASGSYPAGFWPAWWMITRDTAYPPEIDIFEANVPEQEGQVHNGYRNTAGTWTNNYTSIPADGDWHVYGLQLTATEAIFYIDGVPVITATTDGDAYAWTTYYDLAISTDATDGTGYPAAFEADYMRFWLPSGAPAAPRITGISPASGIPSAGSVTVSFTDDVAGAVSYRVTPAPTDYLKDGIGRPDHSAFTGSTSPITVTGLTNGAHYNFTVCAVDAGGNYSIESPPVPRLSPPSGPALAGIA